MLKFFSAKNLLVFFLMILLLGLKGSVSRLWAQDGGSGPSSKSDETGKGLDAAADDRDWDNGDDDDKSDAGTEKSKFKDDSDDTYVDTSAEQDDPSKSKFKDDRDEDDDKATDNSDQEQNDDKN